MKEHQWPFTDSDTESGEDEWDPKAINPNRKTMPDYKQQWCLINGTNGIDQHGRNFFCIYEDSKWSMGFKYLGLTSSSAFYSIGLDIYSEQHLTWFTDWQLQRLFADIMFYEIPSFKIGIRLLITYWLEKTALCLNVGGIISPATFEIHRQTQYIECYSHLITCYSDYQKKIKKGDKEYIIPKWLPDHFIDKCQLSKWVDIEEWKFTFNDKAPWAFLWLFDIDNYTWDPRFCLPGQLNVLDHFALYSTNVILQYWGAFESINDKFDV